MATKSKRASARKPATNGRRKRSRAVSPAEQDKAMRLERRNALRKTYGLPPK